LTVTPFARTWWTALSPDARFLYATVGRANELAVIDKTSNQRGRAHSLRHLALGVRRSPIQR